VDGVDELDPYLPELLALEPLEVPADVLPDAFAEPPQPAPGSTAPPDGADAVPEPLNRCLIRGLRAAVQAQGHASAAALGTLREDGAAVGFGDLADDRQT
jgi:hypothetical protein